VSRVPHPVSFGEALRFWLKLGFVSFGGPAGQIAIMHRELVETRRWISERRFLHALNYCMVLPGPEAQQLATYIGWLLHGTRGAVVAGTLFVLPSVAILIGLSWAYLAFGHNPVMAAILSGVKPSVVPSSPPQRTASDRWPSSSLPHGNAAAAFAALAAFLRALPGRDRRAALVASRAPLAPAPRASLQRGRAPRPCPHRHDTPSPAHAVASPKARHRGRRGPRLVVDPHRAIVTAFGSAATTNMARFFTRPRSSPSAARTRCFPTWSKAPWTSSAGPPWGR